MINQGELNKYITELNKLSKKKLIRIIISFTSDMSNLQIEHDKLKKEGKHDINMHTDDKTAKQIVLTDSTDKG